jgi:hypothetical protein
MGAAGRASSTVASYLQCTSSHSAQLGALLEERDTEGANAQPQSTAVAAEAKFCP